MDEIIDILNENTGEKTGETISKNEAHKKGIWHGSIHVLIVNNDKTKTLLQKRCADKKLYPNTWDIAVGGHISAGEDDLTSAKRELEEELGLNPEILKIEKVDRVPEMLNNNGIQSNEYVSIFVVYKDIEIKDIKLQVEEVSEAKWCSKEELNSLIDQKEIIPHVREYEILNKILKD
jgi:isopentenyldiphosphate isomerase